MDRSFVAATVALLVVLVPVLRRCSWRTAAALALVCATVTAVGPMTPWSVYTREMAPGVEPQLLTIGIEYGRPALALWTGLGGGICFLGVLGAAGAFTLARLPEPGSLPRPARQSAFEGWDPSQKGRRLACSAAVSLGLAALCTLWEYIGVESFPPLRDDEGVLHLRSASAGLELTLLASIAGVACAARAYHRLRTRPVPPTAAEMP